MAASLLSPSATHSKWYFTREQIENNPSRRAGLDPDKELSYRQQAANLLQDMGQRLNVSQLTINTAIVYMHRFYMIQSFTRFHRNVIAPATLFLAAKVEEQPRKLEHVIKVAHACLNPQDPSPDTRSDAYLQQAQDLVILESIILQTLAFEITIDHPHTHVVKCTQLVRASKDLAQTSYFMATNSLHLTTFCLQYSPTIVACVCIHLACKWSNWEIPVSTDSKHWWEYVDPTVTLDLLDELTHEFLQILEKTPNRLKRIRNWKAAGQTVRKTKAEGEGDQADAIMSMISRTSSEGTLAGLMSLSAPPGMSSPSSASSATHSQEEKDRGATGRAGASTELNHEPGGFSQGLHTPAKVTLSEYRAKHADVLAAQKRKLENMEASVKRDYASAAQALISQQRKDRHQQQAGSRPAGTAHDPHNASTIAVRMLSEKERQDRSSLKMRLPLGRGGGVEEGKGRDKRRESSHHHHSSSSHRHSGSGGAPGGSSTRPSSGADSSRASSSSSSSSSSRKRPHPQESTSATYPPKPSKSSRSSTQPPPLLAHSGPPRHQGPHSHSRPDKADTNGHSAAGGSSGQSREFQDTFDMLNSLLSAQGVQPSRPAAFEYRSQYGEYRHPSSSRGSSSRPPPLPAEPPPQLPPLPK
ncbi:hypothetical protein MATL_G00069420 [Megalops atlanticus]|uniref:Cyclin-T1 n=1 Tax=Megalops atlanticus TaxID=7932 RepID=A0A9D3T8S8_MEGAT|nr:hypothetical protein MATL_G00069420 [Megalops atlanticus]